MARKRKGKKYLAFFKAEFIVANYSTDNWEADRDFIKSILGDHWNVSPGAPWNRASFAVTAQRTRNRHHKAKHALVGIQKRWKEEVEPVVSMHFRMQMATAMPAQITTAAKPVSHHPRATL